MANMDARIILPAFMIGHHKHILLVGIDDIDTLAWFEKLFFPPFFGLNVILLIMANMEACNSLLLFMIGYHKHIPLIGIDDIKALAW